MDVGVGNNNFEDAAFALVQALSPAKRLSRDQIPYSQLRTVIGDFVAKQKGSSSALINSITDELPLLTPCNGRRSSISTSFMESDDNSRLSFEDNFSMRTQTLVRVASEKQICSSSSLSCTTNRINGNASIRMRKEIRKMTQTRQRRHMITRCNDRVVFDCTENELPSRVDTVYEELLNAKRSAICCFQILTNSIIDFYSHNTWSDNVEKLAACFLCKYVRKHTDQLSNKYAQLEIIDQERRLIEYETQILIELYSIRFYKESIDESNVLNKLRFICYAADANRMKLFLEETVTDEFSTQIPEHIVRIYEELSVRVPCDLVDYSNECGDEPTNNDDLMFLADEPKRLSTKHLAAIDKVLDEARCTDSIDDKYRNKRRSNRSQQQKSNDRIKKKSYSRSLTFSTNASKLVSPPTTNGHHHNSIQRIIPETPEHKLLNRNKRRASSITPETDDSKSIHLDEVVRQTPISKMRKLIQSKSRQSLYRQQHDRYEKLLKVSERRRQTTNHNNDSTAQSIVIGRRQSAISARELNRAHFLHELINSSGSSSEKCRRNTTPPSSSSSLTMTDAASRKQHHSKTICAAKRNLSEQFARQSSLYNNTQIVASRNQPYSRTQSSAAILSPSSTKNAHEKDNKQQQQSNDGYIIGTDVIDRYRKRIDKIRSAKYRGLQLENEVFYGRGAIRQNLFEEAEMAAANREPCSTIVTRSSQQQQQQQQQNSDNQRNIAAKNRQGRKLTQKSVACCYVANTLLNVNNERPLSPVIPKSLANKLNSPFKLQRMLRLPSRARRRRQLKNRSNESVDRSESSTTILSPQSTIVDDDTSKLDGLFIQVVSTNRKHPNGGTGGGLVLQSPSRINGRLRSAENNVDQKSPTRPRSMSTGDYAACSSSTMISPTTTRHSSRLLLTAIVEESSSSSCQTTVSSSSSGSGHLADAENTLLSADDNVFRLVVQDKMNSVGAPNGFITTGSHQ